MRWGKNDHLLVDARPLHRIMSVCLLVLVHRKNNEESNDLQCWHNKQFRCVSNCVPSTSPNFMGRRWHWTLKSAQEAYNTLTTRWQHAHCLHADKLSNLPNFPNDWLQMLRRRTTATTTCDRGTMHPPTRCRETEREKGDQRQSQIVSLPPMIENTFTREKRRRRDSLAHSRCKLNDCREVN